MTVTAKSLLGAKYAAASATTEYTCAVLHTIIDKFTATNTDTSAQTISVNIVPTGGSAAGSNTVIQAKSIAAGATADLTELQNQIINNGDFLSILASAASKVVIRASGREVT